MSLIYVHITTTYSKNILQRYILRNNTIYYVINVLSYMTLHVMWTQAT